MHSDPPLIGITTSLEKNEQRLNLAYASAIEQAGGLPVIIPFFLEKENALTFSTLLEGLVITGGPAITENMIGSLPPDISATDDRRTRNDRWILERFISRHQPVLGICYGMQLINAHFGGSIYSDVESQLHLPESHSHKRGAKEHAILIEDNSYLRRILQHFGSGMNPTLVNTRHIQAIARPGEGLKVSAVAPDEVVEGIESEDGQIVGVQFHPERMGADGAGLFSNLIHQARSCRD